MPGQVSARMANAPDLVRPWAEDFRAQLPESYRLKLFPRKQWEFDYIAQSARDCGLLTGDKNALGIAVGSEPLIFHFASHAQSVVATDLYSADTAWQTARTEDLQHILDASPFPYPRDRVSMRNADMRSLPFPDEQFDFCWSCSSVEHVGNIAEAVGVYDEIARVLKPGGYAILTTEFCVSPAPYVLPGVVALDPELFRCIVQGHPALELVGDVDFTFDPYQLGNAAEARRYLTGARPNQFLSSWQFHRGRMAQLCGMSTIAPFGFVLRKRGREKADWRQLGLSEPLTALTESLLALDGGRPGEAIDRLQPCLTALTPQFQMIAWRYYLDAVLRSGAKPHAIAAAEDGYLAALPDGDIQDADCGQLLAYSLGEHGRHAEAASVYRRMAGTPSVLADHAITLAIDYLKQAGKAGSAGEARDYLAGTVLDLIEHGVPWSGIMPHLRSTLAAAGQPFDPVIKLINPARAALRRETGNRIGGGPAAIEEA
ncbi:MAG TPA: class I SAM-dependent methyltransferase [Alphaproteobacteria bacterium]|nr:class I SAM-dependent methyltransferase [Alphaproteobacteria bacterium]